MRMGSTWANPNAGNQNYLSALAQQSSPAFSSSSSQNPQNVGNTGTNTNFWDWDHPGPNIAKPAPKPPVPQVRVKPATPAPIVRTPVTQPETQIRQKPRMAPGTQAGPMGQTQNTMAPGGNQSVFGNPSMKAFKKGGAVTTCKISTASKNKSQPNW